jgi:hypothetical protein
MSLKKPQSPQSQSPSLPRVVDPEGRVFTAQTVTFKSPGK